MSSSAKAPEWEWEHLDLNPDFLLSRPSYCVPDSANTGLPVVIALLPGSSPGPVLRGEQGHVGVSEAS